MVEEELSQDVGAYKDISVDVYYADNMNEKLRKELRSELNDIYQEKYTSDVPGTETFPIINIKSRSESTLLIGDEVSFKAVKDALKNV